MSRTVYLDLTARLAVRLEIDDPDLSDDLILKAAKGGVEGAIRRLVGPKETTVPTRDLVVLVTGTARTEGTR